MSKVVGISALLVLLTACTAAEVEGETPKVEGPPSITIAYGGPGASCYSAVYIAQEQGYLEEALAPLGTTVEYTDLSGSVEAVKVLSSGGVDISTGATSASLTANAQGAEIVQISQFLKNDIVYMLAPAGTDASADDPAALVEGKLWGVPSIGSAAHVSALTVLSSWGYDADDVTFVPMGSTAQALAAMDRGVADFYWVGSGGGIEGVVQSGAFDVVVDLFDPAMVQEIYGGGLSTCALFTVESFVKEHPAVVRAVTEAVSRALEFMYENRTNPDAIFAVLPELIQTESNLLSFDRLLLGTHPDGVVDRGDIENTLHALTVGGLIEDPSTIDLDVFIYAD